MFLTEPTPAKINVFLKIVGRRDDGYHLLQSAMLKLGVRDELAVEITPGSGITVEVPGRPELESDSNLCVRAARLFLDARGIDRKIHLRIWKRIPVAAGLGGGSSNAASVLRILNEKLKGMDPTGLFNLASRLGADVPFFLNPAQLALAQGIGEELSPWPSLPVRPILLVNPGHPVSTAEVYKTFDASQPLTWKPADDNSPRVSPPKNWSDLERLIRLGNDLQDAAERLHPEIREIRTELERGDLLAQMSGSGGTVFGFGAEENLAEAEQRLSKRWKVLRAVTAGR